MIWERIFTSRAFVWTVIATAVCIEARDVLAWGVLAAMLGGVVVVNWLIEGGKG